MSMSAVSVPVVRKLAVTALASSFLFGVAIATSHTALSAEASSPPIAAMSADDVYEDIEKTFGKLPVFVKQIPLPALRGAWQEVKDLELSEDTALPAKVKSLIPCDYCIWADTLAAKAAGATDEEIGEAVALAGHTRNWSTLFNGLQVDFDQFKKDLGGEMAAK
jgi:alkylhydroperoxidase/carboxymuconolactone decarboxylase family protein YurZ